MDLKPGGEDETVTVWNMEDYIDRVVEWMLVRGVRAQLDSLRQGFCAVFPMDKLGSFSPGEVRTMLCGDQAPVFTREEILKYTEPKLGYSKDSAGFQRYVVLVRGNVKRCNVQSLQVRQRAGVDEGRGEESLPAVHNRMFLLAPWWPGKPSPKVIDLDIVLVRCSSSYGQVE